MIEQGEAEIWLDGIVDQSGQRLRARKVSTSTQSAEARAIYPDYGFPAENSRFTERVG
jgi:acetyl/propionyl-CoA carboxylase alpha subunit